MFAKSKIVTSLVAFLVACMAVEAVSAVDLPINQLCDCVAHVSEEIHYPNGSLTINNYDVDFSQQICNSLGQANAVYGSVEGRFYCETKSQSASAAYIADCQTLYAVDSQGAQYGAESHCTTWLPPVPVPTSCFCETAAGNNVTATQSSCSAANFYFPNTTFVNNKCTITTKNAYTVFSSQCNIIGVPAAPVCSSL
ncbi:hypothetical protein BGZ99_000128 [Dissophora globulifera]|uniref:Uncharacterized protein n=1 Tax=Dissophora globulifera TaxID=979702 RepID=A0A9P6R204_9FUNG|nr:hypothetical protein BGZ99_000128 [Dissophora globulifera]